MAGQRFQLIRFICRNGNGGESFARNGVTQGAAVEIDQAQIQRAGVSGQKARQQFVGIAQAQMDIAAGVAAFQAFQGQLEGVETGRNRFAIQFKGGDEVNPTRAAHIDFTFFF